MGTDDPNTRATDSGVGWSAMGRSDASRETGKSSGKSGTGGADSSNPTSDARTGLFSHSLSRHRRHQHLVAECRNSGPLSSLCTTWGTAHFFATGGSKRLRARCRFGESACLRRSRDPPHHVRKQQCIGPLRRCRAGCVGASSLRTRARRRRVPPVPAAPAPFRHADNPSLSAALAFVKWCRIVGRLGTIHQEALSGCKPPG